MGKRGNNRRVYLEIIGQNRGIRNWAYQWALIHIEQCQACPKLDILMLVPQQYEIY